MSDVDSSLSRPRAWRPILAWAALAVALGAWWLTLAPTWMGGPATFVLVEGRSMEPMLHTGDAVVARRQDSYQVGDLVVISVYGGHVIHRLVAQAPDGTWTTRGDNNDYDDPWIVTTDNIAGAYWLLVPGLGTYFTWVIGSPLQFGLVCAGVGLLFYVPWRRRRYAPALTEALGGAIKEPPPEGRPALENGVLWVSGSATVVCLVLVGVLGARHQLLSVQGLAVGATLLWSGALALYLAYRLYDGRGVAEPTRSVFALSGRLWLVAELPVLDPPPQPVRSAVALRGIAERYRMPVLHRVDADTGAHEFLLITVQRGAFVWRPSPVVAGKASVEQVDEWLSRRSPDVS